MPERGDRVLNYTGLTHLITRLDARYWDALAQSLTDEEVEALLSGNDIPERGDTSSLNAPEAALLNAAGPKKDRVLNYPGLIHLVGRLDARYLQIGNFAINRITNTELEEMLT